MAARKNDQADEQVSLPRLPPGRHGLSRDYVTQNQRDRLTAGMIASVAERGYHETTISHISAAAGVSRRTFYAYFSSKEEAYLDTFDLIAAHLREAGAGAARDSTDWNQKVAALITTILDAFSANPDLAWFVLIEPRRAGEGPLERYQRGLEEAAAEMTSGFPPSVAPSSVDVQQAILAGMVGIVARAIESGEEDLVGLRPQLIELSRVLYAL
jgi:AcrR family transcriptional regulator